MRADILRSFFESHHSLCAQMTAVADVLVLWCILSLILGTSD